MKITALRGEGIIARADDIIEFISASQAVTFEPLSRGTFKLICGRWACANVRLLKVPRSLRFSAGRR